MEPAVSLLLPWSKSVVPFYKFNTFIYIPNCSVPQKFSSLVS